MGAHLYKDLPNDEQSQKATKKRIWWCLIRQDRFMALALRRPVQVLPHVFDTQVAKLEDGFESISIYSETPDQSTKPRLEGTFNVQCWLAVVLTELIMLVYSPRSIYTTGKMEVSDVLALVEKVHAVEAGMALWLQKATETLNHSSIMTGGCYETVNATSQTVYIYYHSGQIALGQYKAFLAELYPAYVENIPALGQERVCRHIYDAVSSVNYHVRQLILRRVVHAVSADIVLYTAFPILCLMIDVQLASSAGQLEEARRLSMYSLEILKHCEERILEGDDVLCFIAAAFKRAHGLLIRQLPSDLITMGENTGYLSPSEDSMSDSQLFSMDSFTTIYEYLRRHEPLPQHSVMPQSWDDLLLHYPRLYLHLSLFLDTCISRNSLPKSYDLPRLVRNFDDGRSEGRTSLLESVPYGCLEDRQISPENSVTQSLGDSEATGESDILAMNLLQDIFSLGDITIQNTAMDSSHFDLEDYNLGTIAFFGE
ncbi:unnamed protein product [Penicillium crustosum]